MSRKLIPGFTNLYVDGSGALFIGAEGDYSTFCPCGSLSMVGNARVYRHLVVPAGAFVKQGVADPDQGWEGLYETQDFDDAIEQSLYYDVNIPYRWSAGTDITVHVLWLHDTNAADAGKFVRWGVEYRSCAEGEAWAGGDGSVTADQAGLNANQGLRINTDIPVIPAADLAIHDQLGFRFYRDATNDDYVGDARLVEVHLEFVMERLGEHL